MQDIKTMTIDGIPVEIGDEKNLLELIRKIGIELPTFCYHSELSIYGACRMCMVENEWGSLAAACSEQPRAGMEIKTNTERLRKYRKNILELLLANHCRDCTTCAFNGKCKLQELATRFNITGVRFPNTAQEPKLDESSVCITKDQNKCILCGDCVRMCNEIQDVGAIDFAHRGSKMTISTAFDIPIAESNCVGCGQCAAVCPTGAITVKNDLANLWKDLDDEDTLMTVQIAPAVRVALGKEFGLPEGENTMGLIVAALRRIGFDEIYDTTTGADLTVLEEAKEFLGRLEKGGKLPLFTSCCPAWINFCETKYPEMMPHVSTCRSPMQMLASVIKEQYRMVYRRTVHVAVMPCTAKKFEAKRREFSDGDKQMVDYVITTQELVKMIKESGLLFNELEAEAVDAPLGMISGAGMIFGVSGGVTEAVLRRVSADKSLTALNRIALKGVRGMKGVKEATVVAGDRQLNIAIVSGLGNASALIEKIKKGTAHYDLIEVMACPGGCVAGAGQPHGTAEQHEQRGKGLYAADKMCGMRRAEDNPLMLNLYRGVLKDRTHELLHVHYAAARHHNGN